MAWNKDIGDPSTLDSDSSKDGNVEASQKCI